MKRSNLAVGTCLAMIMLLASGQAFSNSGKGGKGGGGGGSDGGGSGSDPCAVTTSFFPSIAYVVSSSTRNKTQNDIYLASADASCARIAATLTASAVDASMRLHLNEGTNSGFLVVLERQNFTYRVVVIDFLVGTNNVLSNLSSRTLLERSWDPGTQTGTVLLNIGLSPDGDTLLVIADDGDTSSVLSCAMAAAVCEPEPLLHSAVTDYFFWSVAPSADPARFFVTITYESDVPFPRYQLAIASRQMDGSWALATDTPLARSGNNLFDLDGHPYDSNKIAWRDTGNMSTPATVHVCAVTPAGECGAGSWSITEARFPTWSRRGRLAQPEHELPSLLYRGVTSNGKVAHYETFDGLVLEPLAVPSSLRWDAY